MLPLPKRILHETWSKNENVRIPEPHFPLDVQQKCDPTPPKTNITRDMEQKRDPEKVKYLSGSWPNPQWTPEPLPFFKPIRTLSRFAVRESSVLYYAGVDPKHN